MLETMAVACSTYTHHLPGEATQPTVPIEWVVGDMTCPSDTGIRSGVPLAWKWSIRGQRATGDP